MIRAHRELSSTREEKIKADTERIRLKDELDSVKKELNAAKDRLETIDRTFAVTKTEMKDQIAGWVKKNENTDQRCRALERQLYQVQLGWEKDRQQWEVEKAQLDRRVKMARKKLDRPMQKPASTTNTLNDTFSVQLSAFSQMGGFLPSLLTVADDSESFDTDDEDESR
jgi:chromosome segregation ATPase